MTPPDPVARLVRRACPYRNNPYHKQVKCPLCGPKSPAAKPDLGDAPDRIGIPFAGGDR